MTPCQSCSCELHTQFWQVAASTILRHVAKGRRGDSIPPSWNTWGAAILQHMEALSWPDEGLCGADPQLTGGQVTNDEGQENLAAFHKRLFHNEGWEGDRRKRTLVTSIPTVPTYVRLPKKKKLLASSQDFRKIKQNKSGRIWIIQAQIA